MTARHGTETGAARDTDTTTGARTLVLLHGTPLSPEVWSETASLLGPEPVVIPDCTRVPDRADAQSAMAAALAVDLVGDLDVVGHSFGGQIATELALRIPGRVRTLTLICTRDTPFPAFAESARALRSGAGPSVEETLARWFAPEDIDEQGAAVQMARRCLEHADRAAWAAALAAIAGYDRAGQMGSLTMPVTVVAAGYDTVSPPAVMAELAQRLPDAVVETYPNWRHMSPFTEPHTLATVIDRSRHRGGLQ